MPTTNLTLTVDTVKTNASWVNPTNAIGANGAVSTNTNTILGSTTLAINTNASSVIPANAIFSNMTIVARIRTTIVSGSRFYLREIGARGFGDSSPYGAEPMTTSLANYTLFNGTLEGAAIPQSEAFGAIWFRCYIPSGATASLDDITMSLTWEAPASGSALFFGENF